MSEKTIYRIAKWDSVFERAESRKLKQLTWLAMPIGFDSTGYQLLLDEFGDDAAAIYGAWCTLCAVAASCHHRGMLASSRGNPLKTSHVARMTGFPEVLFVRLIAWASQAAVGWLEVVDIAEVRSIVAKSQDFSNENGMSGESPDASGDRRGIPPSTQQDLTQPNKTRQDPTTPNPTKPNPAAAVDWREVWRESLKDRDFCFAVGEVAIRFGRLKRLQLDRDLIFQVAWVGVAFDRGTVDDLVDRLRDDGENKVTKQKHYVEAVMRKLCESKGETWNQLKRCVPPTPPPAKHASVAEAMEVVT